MGDLAISHILLVYPSMTSTIQRLLASVGDEAIDYGKVVAEFPWIVEEDQDCIISPDSDGMLCGLFMSKHLGWKIRGFYDGKVLVVENGVKPGDCVFLDMEILRRNVRSVGQHMVVFNKDRIPDRWSDLNQLVSPNIVRGYDGYHLFRLKYPFGTVHFLMGIINHHKNFDIPKTAIAPLLFTDGTWMNLFGYTENSLSWISYLRANEGGPLHSIFMSDQFTMHQALTAMDQFLRQRDEISVYRERGDRITITLRGGDGLPHNLDMSADNLYSFQTEPRGRAERFINLLANLTGWEYVTADWSWDNWKLLTFTKGAFNQEPRMNLNNRNFETFVQEVNPLSLAQTSTNNIEYTVESPDNLV